MRPVYVSAGMDRGEILLHHQHAPGPLKRHFLAQVGRLPGEPVIGIITNQFPAVADAVLSWVQPGLDAIGW